MAPPTQRKARSDKKPSAAFICLGIPELLEGIVHFLDAHDLTRLYGVCTELAQQMEQNPRLQRLLLYRSGNASNVWEVDLAANTISKVNVKLATSASPNVFYVIPGRFNELCLTRSARGDGPSDAAYLSFKLLADLIPREIQLFSQLEASRRTQAQSTGGLVGHSIGAATWKSNIIPTRIEVDRAIRRQYITDPPTHRAIMKLRLLYGKCPEMSPWNECGPDIQPIYFPARVCHRGLKLLVDDYQYRRHDKSKAFCLNDETITVVGQEGPIRVEDVIWHLEQHTHVADTRWPMDGRTGQGPLTIRPDD